MLKKFENNVKKLVLTTWQLVDLAVSRLGSWFLGSWSDLALALVVMPQIFAQREVVGGRVKLLRKRW